MEFKDTSVPYIVYEGEQARNERHIRRLVIALIVAVVVIFVSNAIWLYAWMQYDYAGSDTVTVDGKSGIANYIGGSGDIHNGEDYGYEDADQDAEEW